MVPKQEGCRFEPGSSGREAAGVVSRLFGLGVWSQERIVLALAVLLFAISAALLPGFLAPNNLISIVRSVSVLGILALGMAIVIIGRGIDLAAVAIMAMSAAWYLQLLNDGWSDGPALLITVVGVLAIGVANGFLIAYADVPAIFATLASGAFVFGYVRSQLITQDAVPVPPGHWLESVGGSRFLGVPAEVFIFAGAAFMGYLFLRYTKWGRFVYFMGDNFQAARNLEIGRASCRERV